MTTSLSADEARLIALWRQGFVEPIGGVTPSRAQRLGQAARARLVDEMLDHLGAVQLDTISVLARSHELVAYARLGAVDRAGRRARPTGGAAATFEYWSHAACLLPMESWPLFAFRRRHYARRGVRWHDVTSHAVAEVLAQLKAEGPLNTTHIGGAKRGGQWWDWSDAKVAIEWLLDIGTVVVTRRVGLASRVRPGRAGGARARCVRSRAGSMRTASSVPPTRTACASCFGSRPGSWASAPPTTSPTCTGSSRADVRPPCRGGRPGDRSPSRAGSTAATRLARRWTGSRRIRAPPCARRCCPRSTRWSGTGPRTERLFGMTHRLEAYTPAHKRVHGYFAMPVLHQGRLVARVDPKRQRCGARGPPRDLRGLGPAPRRHADSGRRPGHRAGPARGGTLGRRRTTCPSVTSLPGIRRAARAARRFDPSDGSIVEAV